MLNLVDGKVEAMMESLLWDVTEWQFKDVTTEAYDLLECAVGSDDVWKYWTEFFVGKLTSEMDDCVRVLQDVLEEQGDSSTWSKTWEHAQNVNKRIAWLGNVRDRFTEVMGDNLTGRHAVDILISYHDEDREHIDVFLHNLVDNTSIVLKVPTHWVEDLMSDAVVLIHHI